MTYKIKRLKKEETYQVIDVDTGKIVAEYDTDKEAIEAVRHMYKEELGRSY